MCPYHLKVWSSDCPLTLSLSCSLLSLVSVSADCLTHHRLILLFLLSKNIFFIDNIISHSLHNFSMTPWIFLEFFVFPMTIKIACRFESEQKIIVCHNEANDLFRIYSDYSGISTRTPQNLMPKCLIFK